MKRAATDEAQLEALVKDYRAFLLRCASSAVHHSVSTHDDEWAQALEAFYRAVRSYTPSRGGFLPFAEVVIRRQLLDFLRRQQRFSPEVAVEPQVFDGDLSEQDAQLPLALEVERRMAEQAEQQPGSLREEIEAANPVFAAYGFSFFDLAACSPKAQKTRSACALAVRTLLDCPLLLKEMRRTRQLPIKILEKYSGVPRKILERHRKYIIAATELLGGEYPGLGEYLWFIRKERDI